MRQEGKLCKVDACSKPARTRGYCNAHYLRWWKGDLNEKAPIREFGLPVEQRLLSAIEYDPNGGCWFWSKSLDTYGYGHLNVDGKTLLAHRLSYQTFKTEIPEGLELDHTCRCRLCINPEHLEPVAGLENIQRGFRFGSPIRGRSFCKNGHEYTPENTYVDKNGYKECRVCRRSAEERRIAKNGPSLECLVDL